MAKKAKTEQTAGLMGQDKALVIAALDRAVAVLESKDQGGKAEALATGAYPVDLRVRIRGDINVAEGSTTAGYEAVTDERHFTAEQVLAAIWEQYPNGREDFMANALRMLAAARKKGDESKESVALKNAGNACEQFLIARGKRLSLIQPVKRIVPATTRAGARTGKPDVEIDAEIFGKKRGVTFQVSGGAATKAA